MKSKYEYSESLQVLAEDISRRLFPYIETSRIKCYKTSGEDGRVIARCHTLSELMQRALGIKSFYVLEFMKEKFNLMTTEEKVKVVIHELMYIKESFNGSFRKKDGVSIQDINSAYISYLGCRKNNTKINWFSLNK